MSTKLHQHECNTHKTNLFNLENTNKYVFLYYIYCKENKCWKIF
jgi:hypothetical protein